MFRHLEAVPINDYAQINSGFFSKRLKFRISTKIQNKVITFDAQISLKKNWKHLYILLKFSTSVYIIWMYREL